jgi:hypothetical protein
MVIMKKMYGIKDPDIENEKSIKKKVLKFKLDTSNIVTVNSRDFPKVLGAQGIPDCSIYDKNGKYIEYRRTDTSCNAGLFEFIPNLNPINSYRQPDSLSLDKQYSKYRDLKGNTLTEIAAADFYVLIYWTVWTGKLNSDHVKPWEDLAKANKNCNVKVIKVNLDLQEWWDKKDRDQIIEAWSKKKKKK